MYVEAPPSSASQQLTTNTLQQYFSREQEVTAWLIKHNEEYSYWADLKRRPLPPGLTAEEAWSLLKMTRAANRRSLLIDDLPGFFFTYHTTDATLARLHRFDMYLGGIMRSDSLIPEEEKSSYLVSSVMEEAIASSQLEGAATTREVAKDMLRKKRPPRDKSEQMILNNYQTIRFIQEQKQQPLTPEMLCQIQAHMTDATLHDASNSGQFRQHDNVEVWNEAAGEVVYVPPAAAELPQLLAALCAFANEEPLAGAPAGGQFIHPIVRASILHFLVGYIHPFVDGNGRMARAVFYWYLLRKGYWLLEYMSISRIIQKSATQYAKAYLHTEHDQNDLTYFINYQVKTLDLAFDSLEQYISRKVSEKKQMYSFRRLGALNERQLAVVQELARNPEAFWTIREMQHRFGVVYQTARTDLMGLEELGLLHKRQAGKQKLLYFRADDFDQRLAALK